MSQQVTRTGATGRRPRGRSRSVHHLPGGKRSLPQRGTLTRTFTFPESHQSQARVERTRPIADRLRADANARRCPVSRTGARAPLPAASWDWFMKHSQMHHSTILAPSRSIAVVRLDPPPSLHAPSRLPQALSNRPELGRASRQSCSSSGNNRCNDVDSDQPLSPPALRPGRCHRWVPSGTVRTCPDRRSHQTSSLETAHTPNPYATRTGGTRHVLMDAARRLSRPTHNESVGFGCHAMLSACLGGRRASLGL